MYAHYTPAFRPSCPKPFSFSVSIAESAVASFAVPVLRIQHPFSTQRPFPLCTPRVVRPLLRMHLPPRLFFLHACVTRATLKSTVLLPSARCRPHPRLHLAHHSPALLLGPSLRAAHGLSYHRHHRTLHSPMTCGTTLFESGPIFARPPEAGGGHRNSHPFLIT
jgi:hypothetical protein